MTIKDFRVIFFFVKLVALIVLIATADLFAYQWALVLVLMGNSENIGRTVLETKNHD